MFIGRWQPFHGGHRALIETALDAGNEVIVGIRDTELSRDNPFSVSERVEMIRGVFDERVKLCVIPDFDEICYGRGVGYTFRQIELTLEIEAISGTVIRQAKGVLWLTGNSRAGGPEWLET